MLRKRPRRVLSGIPRCTRRTACRLALVGLLALGLVAPAPAAPEAPTPCANQILADWFDNGRIDSVYPPSCYEQAIDGLPIDLRDYSDAEEVISRALASAIRGGGNDSAERTIEDGFEAVPGIDDTATASSGPPVVLLVALAAFALTVAVGYLLRRAFARR